MKDEINFDDFSKLDIRIGEVIAAEKVEDTDKLIRCVVDFGREIGSRQIVSGIAMHIEPEELIGRKFPYLINLAPRTIRGVESQGMILAVGGEEFSLLVPANIDLAVGSKVS